MLERPFVVVTGGADVRGKLALLEEHGAAADAVLVGGLLAVHLDVANPLPFPVELPLDVVAADRLAPDAETVVCAPRDVPYGWLQLDIGPRTRARFAQAIAGARTVLWRGAMGLHEWPAFAAGTAAVAEAIAASGAQLLSATGTSTR